VTFRDVAAMVCNDDHVLAAAVELVRSRVRRNVKLFRVQTVTGRYECGVTVLAVSDEIQGPAAQCPAE
jgi:hypothetical protein